MTIHYLIYYVQLRVFLLEFKGENTLTIEQIKDKLDNIENSGDWNIDTKVTYFIDKVIDDIPLPAGTVDYIPNGGENVVHIISAMNDLLI